jgi:hypothetical protein
MSGPGTPVYIRWTLHRVNQTCGHHVPVPVPNQLGTSEDPLGTPTGGPQALFVCPECGFVTFYSRSDADREPSATPDPYQDALALVYIEAECADNNCESLTRIHAAWDVGKNKLAGSKTVAGWVIDPDAKCECGRSLASLQTVRPRYFAARMPF